MHKRSVIQRDHCSAEVKRESQIIYLYPRKCKRYKMQKFQPAELWQTRKPLSQKGTIGQHKDHVLNFDSPRIAEKAVEEQGWH